MSWPSAAHLQRLLLTTLAPAMQAWGLRPRFSYGDFSGELFMKAVADARSTVEHATRGGGRLLHDFGIVANGRRLEHARQLRMWWERLGNRLHIWDRFLQWHAQSGCKSVPVPCAHRGGTGR